MHSLSESVGIADNAATAQKARRTDVAQLVQTAVREQMGEEAYTRTHHSEVGGRRRREGLARTVAAEISGRVVGGGSTLF